MGNYRIGSLAPTGTFIRGLGGNIAPERYIEFNMQLQDSLPTNNLDFAWDRHESKASLHKKLADETSPDWPNTAAWLMREARVEQVWEFLSLAQIKHQFPRISPLLGRRRPLWEYILCVAHELGKI